MMVAALGRHAQEHHAARNALEHIGPVLGAHHGSGRRNETALAEHGAGYVLRQVHHAAIIDGDRIAFAEARGRLGAMGIGKFLDELDDAGLRGLARPFGHGAQRAFDLD